MGTPRSDRFTRPQIDEDKAMADAIVGKTFGNGARKFGAFKHG
jgi:hypothetical protein